MKKEKIIGTAEAWENGELGQDADHAVAAGPTRSGEARNNAHQA